jgi:hypothetical protein
MNDTCECGHVLDEHGGDPKHPRALACTVEGCQCVHFEAAEEEDDES